MFILRLISVGALVAVLTLVSCSQSLPVLKVKQDRISQEHTKSDDKMVAFISDNELKQHLHPRDKKAAEGEYFTFIWDNLAQDLEDQSSSDLQLVFYYRATKTQSKVLKEVWNIQGLKQLEFAYTQKWIEDKGELLSWKAEIKSGKQTLAEQQSYLWKDSY